MGKKAKKRWRTVPIELCSFKPIGRKDNDETEPIKERITPSPPAPTFNEDEYTKITTPRQDVLFKKGYLGRRRLPNVTSDESTLEHHSQDSMKSDQYVNDSPDPAQMILPPPAYIDPSAVYFINGSGYEVYDPYTGSLTVVVGPPAPQYTAGGHPILTAIPYQPVPLQPLEWFNPQPPPTQWAPPSSYSYKKRFSFDSQNWSAQSSESTGPPSSPQETELVDDSGMASQYQYSGYMYSPYINDVTAQTAHSDTVGHIETGSKRRKQLRKRRRREGIADGGSESSCEDQCYQSGASVELTNDSKTASDSGVNTHNSGGSTPVNSLPPYGSTQLVNGFEKLGSSSLDDGDTASLKTLNESGALTLTLTSQIPPNPNDPQTPGCASDANDAIERRTTQSPPLAVPSVHSHVPVIDVTSSILNGEHVDSIEAASNSTAAILACPGGAFRGSSDVFPIDENPSSSAVTQNSDIDTDNKENCDVNICSKQEASNISCNSKLFSKSNLNDSKLVENNSIHSCNNNETGPDSGVSVVAEDLSSNSRSDKSSSKQNKALNGKPTVAPSPKSQSKKSKSKSKSKTQQTPGSKQPASKTTCSDENNAEFNGTDVTGSSKTNKKLKKNQERKSKENVPQENQRIDIVKGEEQNQEEEVKSTVLSELEAKCNVKEENDATSDAKLGSKTSGTETNVISELQSFESQSSINSLAICNGNLNTKNEAEFHLEVGFSESQNVASKDTQENSDDEVNSENCRDGSMEPKNSIAASAEDPRLLATFINLDQIDVAVQLHENEDMGISKFSSCRDVEPKRPPRRKKSEKRLAENVAGQVLEEVFDEAVQKVSETQSAQPPGRITEAVSKWLSENGGVLPPLDQDDESEEEDDVLENESVSTGSKNAQGNPFPASLLEDDGSPPREDGKRVANSTCSIDTNNGTVTTLVEESQLPEIVDDSECTIRNRFNEKPSSNTATDQIDTSNHLNKTDPKVHHSSSFPCGICCNIL